MTIGQRIEARRIALGIASQSELARRAKVGQSTLSGLIRKPYRSSPYLPQIARALHTTVDYLAGHTDDPDRADLTSELSASTHVLLPVELPSAPALARMFEGLLRAMPPTADLDEQAQLLAKWLPIGLSQIRDLLPAAPTSSAAAEPTVRKELAEALATPDRAPR